jgi:hypothetical protein
MNVASDYHNPASQFGSSLRSTDGIASKEDEPDVLSAPSDETA